MLSKLFLGMSLVGAEWVLYLLLALSILSVALILERFRFYREASSGLEQFRNAIRKAAAQGDWAQALQLAKSRSQSKLAKAPDFESGLSQALLEHSGKSEALAELAQDALIKTKIQWEKNLSILATIGSNAPFVGLFGTVLGIIQAFHDLSQRAGTGAQTVTAGISEALIATAVGILVAIPAVVAFNLYQRKVKSAVSEAEALKSFLIGLKTK